jgi:hypothetical protein
MYFPCPNQVNPHPVTGTIEPAASIIGLAYKVRTALEAVNGEIDTVAVSTVPAIMSKIGSGTTKPVAHIGVGPIMDTMRSRRQALNDDVAQWLDATWPTGFSAGAGVRNARPPARRQTLTEEELSEL